MIISTFEQMDVYLSNNGTKQNPAHGCDCIYLRTGHASLCGYCIHLHDCIHLHLKFIKSMPFFTALEASFLLYINH